MHRSTWNVLPAWGVFAIFLAWIGYLAFSQCFYNWDMLAYGAAVLTWSGEPDVHAATYAAFRAQVPEAAMTGLVAGDYPAHLATHGEDFLSQLGFYTVKPLYVALLTGLYLLGVPLVATMMMVSAVAVMLAAGLVLTWLRRYLPLGQAVIATVLLGYATRLVDLARGGSPDALSVLLVLLGLFLLLEVRWRLTALMVLLLAITTRGNNAVFFVLVAGYLAWQETGASRWRILALLAGGVALHGLINAGGHGWWLLFHHTFIHPVNNLHHFDQPFSWASYGVVQWHALQALTIRGMAMSTVLWPFAFLGAALFFRRPASRPWLWLALLNLLALLALFPAVGHWDRFLVPFYVWVGIALIGALATQTNPRSLAN